MSLFSRLFGGGEAPEEYVALAGDPATLFSAERIPMTGRVEHLRSPNRRASKAVTAHYGRIVIARDQVVVMVRKRLRCHATITTDESAPLTISLRRDGLTIDLDVAKALPPNGAGTAQLVVRTHLPEAVLAQLPGRTLHATVPEADVLSMTRWV